MENEAVFFFRKILSEDHYSHYEKLFQTFFRDCNSEVIKPFKNYTKSQKYEFFNIRKNEFLILKDYVFIKKKLKFSTEIQNSAYQRLCSAVAFLLNCYEPLHYQELYVCICHSLRDIQMALCSLNLEEQEVLLKSFPIVEVDNAGFFKLSFQYQILETSDLSSDEKILLCIVGYLAFYKKEHFEKLIKNVKSCVSKHCWGTLSSASISDQFHYIKSHSFYVNISNDGTVTLPKSFIFPKIKYKESSISASKIKEVSEVNLSPDAKTKEKTTNQVIPSPLGANPQVESSHFNEKFSKRIRNSAAYLVNYFKLSSKLKLVRIILHVLKGIRLYLGKLPISSQKDIFEKALMDFHISNGYISLKPGISVDSYDLIEEERILLFITCFLKESGETHYRKIFIGLIDCKIPVPKCINSDSDQFRYLRDQPRLFSIHNDGYVSLCKLPTLDSNIKSLLSSRFSCLDIVINTSKCAGKQIKDSKLNLNLGKNQVLVNSSHNVNQCTTSLLQSKTQSTCNKNSIPADAVIDGGIKTSGKEIVNEKSEAKQITSIDICKKLECGIKFLSKYFEISDHSHFIEIIMNVLIDVKNYFEDLSSSAQDYLILKYFSLSSLGSKQGAKSFAGEEKLLLSNNEKMSLFMAYILSQHEKIHYQELFKQVQIIEDFFDFKLAQICDHLKEHTHLFLMQEDGFVKLTVFPLGIYQKLCSNLSSNELRAGVLIDYRIENKKLCSAILFLLRCFEVLHYSELKMCICYALKDVELYLSGFSNQKQYSLFSHISGTCMEENFMKLESTQPETNYVTNHEKLFLFITCLLGFCGSVPFEELVQRIKKQTLKEENGIFCDIPVACQHKYIKKFHPYILILENGWVSLPENFEFPKLKYEKTIHGTSPKIRQRSKSVCSPRLNSNDAITLKSKNVTQKERNDSYITVFSNVAGKSDAKKQLSSEDFSKISKQLNSCVAFLMNHFELIFEPHLFSVIFLVLEDLQKKFFKLSQSCQTSVFTNCFQSFEVDKNGLMSFCLHDTCNFDDLSIEKENVLLIAYMIDIHKEMHYRKVFEKFLEMKRCLPKEILTDSDKFWYLFKRDRFFYTHHNGYFKLQQLPDIWFDSRSFLFTENSNPEVLVNSISNDKFIDIGHNLPDVICSKEVNEILLRLNENITTNCSIFHSNQTTHSQNDNLYEKLNFYERISSSIVYLTKTLRFSMNLKLFLTIIHVLGDINDFFRSLSAFNQKIILKIGLFCNDEIQLENCNSEVSVSSMHLKDSDKILLHIAAIVSEKTEIHYKDVHLCLKNFKSTSKCFIQPADLYAYIQRREKIFHFNSAGCVSLWELPKIKSLLENYDLMDYIANKIENNLDATVSNLVFEVIAVQIRSYMMYLSECFGKLSCPHLLSIIFLTLSDSKTFFNSLPDYKKFDLLTRTFCLLDFDENEKLILNATCSARRYNLNHEEKQLLFIAYKLSTSGEMHFSALLKAFLEYEKNLSEYEANSDEIAYFNERADIFCVMEGGLIKLATLPVIGLSSKLFSVLLQTDHLISGEISADDIGINCETKPDMQQQNLFKQAVASIKNEQSNILVKDVKNNSEKENKYSCDGNVLSKNETRDLEKLNVQNNMQLYKKECDSLNQAPLETTLSKKQINLKILKRIENGMKYITKRFGYLAKVNESMVLIVIQCLGDVKNFFFSLLTADQFEFINFCLSSQILKNGRLILEFNESINLTTDEKFLLFSTYVLTYQTKMYFREIFKKFHEDKECFIPVTELYFKSKHDIFSVHNGYIELYPLLIIDIGDCPSNKIVFLTACGSERDSFPPRTNLVVVKRVIKSIIFSNRTFSKSKSCDNLSTINSSKSSKMKSIKPSSLAKQISSTNKSSMSTSKCASNDFTNCSSENIYKRIADGFKYFMHLNLSPNKNLLMIIMHVLEDVKQYFSLLSKSDKLTFVSDCCNICGNVRRDMKSSLYHCKKGLSSDEENLLCVCYVLQLGGVMHYRKVFLNAIGLSNNRKLLLSDKKQFHYFKEKELLFLIKGNGFVKLQLTSCVEFQEFDQIKKSTNIEIKSGKTSEVNIDSMKKNSNVSKILNEKGNPQEEICISRKKTIPVSKITEIFSKGIQNRIRQSASLLCDLFKFITDKLLVHAILHVLEDVQLLFVSSPNVKESTVFREMYSLISNEEELIISKDSLLEHNLNSEEKYLLLFTCILLRSEPYHYLKLFQKCKILNIPFPDCVATNADKLEYFKKRAKYFTLNSDDDVLLKRSPLCHLFDVFSDQVKQSSPTLECEGKKLSSDGAVPSVVTDLNIISDHIMYEITNICNEILHNTSKLQENFHLFHKTVGAYKSSLNLGLPQSHNPEIISSCQSLLSTAENTKNFHQLSSSIPSDLDVPLEEKKLDTVSSDSTLGESCENFKSEIHNATIDKKNSTDENITQFDGLQNQNSLTNLCNNVSKCSSSKDVHENSCGTEGASLIALKEQEAGFNRNDPFSKHSDKNDVSSSETLLGKNEHDSEKTSENNLYIDVSVETSAAELLTEQRVVMFFIINLGSTNGASLTFLSEKLEYASKEVQDFMSANYPNNIIPFFRKYPELFFVSKYTQLVYLRKSTMKDYSIS